ncbi:MAG: tetratricopeptide repeat protein [Leptospiraceae bacterium]|nr:tetratricopeptide repeat protein [Leptospiraceae bacterium]
MHNEAGSYNELICCKSEIIKQAIEEKLNKIEKENSKEDPFKIKFENKLNNFSNPSPIFTGRKTELIDLREAYSKFDIISISGFGGIGKTEFINQFIYELDIADKKNQITWLDGNENSSFELFVKEAGFEVILQSNDTDQKKYAAFKDKINEHKRVVFLDNFQDIEKADPKFREFIEFANGKIPDAKIIILSRTEPKFKNVLFKSVHLSGLKEAVEFAKQIIETKFSSLKITESNLQTLCNYVDNHPFAIELSLNLCDSYGFDNIIGKIAEYKSFLPELEELSKRLFEDVLNQPSTKQEERDFIFQFSIFNEKVDADTIKSVLGIDLFKAVHLLKQKNLISIENNLYDTHPLIKEFCYDKLENKENLHQRAAQYFISKRSDKLDVTLEEQIFYHLKACDNNQEIENSLNKYGKLLVKQAYYDFIQNIIEYLVIQKKINPLFNLLLGDINRIKCNWDQALFFYEKTKAINSNKELALEALLQIADIFRKKGDYSKALVRFNECLEIAIKSKLQKYEAWAYDGIGVIKEFYGETNNALELFQKALKISKDLGEKEDIADLLNNIGNIYSENKKDQALEYFKASLKINEETGNKFGIARCYNNIGALYSKDDKEKALKYYYDSLKISEEIGDKEGNAYSYNNIGNIYSIDDKDKVLKYYNDSLKIREEIGNKEGIANSSHNIGEFYRQIKDFEKSLLFLFKAFVIYRQMQNIRLKNAKELIEHIRNNMGVYDFIKKANQAIENLDSEYRSEIDIDEFLPQPIKSKREFGPNAQVKVKFRDGKIATFKYKKESDIKNGGCEIVEE